MRGPANYVLTEQDLKTIMDEYDLEYFGEPRDKK